jgi:hypothetical protein
MIMTHAVRIASGMGSGEPCSGALSSEGDPYGSLRGPLIGPPPGVR